MRRALLWLVGVGLFAGAPPARLVPVDEAQYPALVAAQKGKVVLVNFWATWCSPCRAEMPLLAKLETRYRAKGLTLVTISADEPEDGARALQFLGTTGVSGPAYLRQTRDENRFIDAIDAKWSGALPALFLYDRTGKRVRSFVGESDIKDIEAAIRQAL